jgi:hypothetical protein
MSPNDRISKPVRRVVTGTRPDGKSAVLHDSDNPYRYTRGGGSKNAFNEIWTFDTSPAPLAGDKDGADRPLSHSPPAEGAHFRVIQSPKQDDSVVNQAEADRSFAAMNTGGLSELLKGARHWNMHRTRTVDYGIAAHGERVHILPESEFVMRKGDVVVQLGQFHSWGSTRSENVMIFEMIGGESPFDEES